MCDTSIRVTQLDPVYGMTHVYVFLNICTKILIGMCEITCSFVWYDFPRVLCEIYKNMYDSICDIIWTYDVLESQVLWDIYINMYIGMCDTIWSRVCHDSIICAEGYVHEYVCQCVTSRHFDQMCHIDYYYVFWDMRIHMCISMCDTIWSRVCRDSFICVLGYLHEYVCQCVWYNLIMCVTWFLHVYSGTRTRSRMWVR